MNSSSLFFFIAGLLVILVAIALPPIPVSRTVTEEYEECNREILFVMDISSSMTKSFSDATSAIHKFASGRPGDCFGLVVFTGPDTNFFLHAPREGEYAFLLNHGIFNPDELILPLRETVLRQFARGTLVSDGLFVAEEFFQDQEQGVAPVIVLVSDLGNEEFDNAKALATMQRLIARGIHVYVLAVGIPPDKILVDGLAYLVQDTGIPYMDIQTAQDFTDAYRFIDKFESVVISEPQTRLVTAEIPNTWLFSGALLLMIVPFGFSRLTRRRV